MTYKRFVNINLDESILALITAEQRRLEAELGMKINMTMAARVLIVRGAKNQPKID